MRRLGAGIRFLTRLPFGPADPSVEDLGRSAPWFPVVGALVGALTACAFLLASLAFPPIVARSLALVVQVTLYGAFHLDGLSDTVDGLYGGQTREEALRIMRDPHVGAMGVLSIVLALLLKIGALLALPDNLLALVLFAAPVVGHGAMVASFRVRCARPDGLARAFADHRRLVDLPISVLAAAGVSFAVFGVHGWIPLVGAMVASGGLMAFALRRIGGVTGDVCGAVSEIAETAFLVLSTAVIRSGP